MNHSKETRLIAILAFLLAWAFGCFPAQAQSFAYVANEASDNVSVINTATNTVVATVTVGNAPFGVAITPDGAFAHVTNAGSGSVSVIKTTTKTVMATVTVGTEPVGVAITPRCREDDGEGDVRGEREGAAHFRMHLAICLATYTVALDFSDPSFGTDFHSTQVNSVNHDDVVHSVTIKGLGTDNGRPVTFTIIAVDSTVVPPGIFSIILSDGYSNSGKLLNGSITLH